MAQRDRSVGRGTLLALIRLPLMALLLALMTGCLTLGKAKVLAFDYEARDRFLGRDGPDVALAIGGHVDLNVYSRSLPPVPPAGDADGLRGVAKRRSPGGFDPVALLGARSSIPEVVRVDAPSGPRVRLHGVSPGQADISVESELGGDTVTVSVAEIETAIIDHWLLHLTENKTSPAEAAFLQGGVGRFTLAMRDASGRAVVGAGVVPPITVEPPGAAVIPAIADGDLRHVEIRFDSAGILDLGMRRSGSLRIPVLDAAAVTALELVALDLLAGDIGSPASLRRGRGLGVGVRGVLQDGRRVLLLGDVARIAGATPEVCATPADQTEQVRLVFGDGVTAVDAVAPGTCTLVATLGPLRAALDIPVEISAEPEAAAGPVTAPGSLSRPRP